MPTSYTSLLGLALPVTGELSGTWGDTVNDYITRYVDASVAGTQAISGSQTAVTLTVTNGTTLTQVGSGSSGSAQYAVINCTGNPAGLLTITAPASSRQYLIINATSTSQSVKIVGAGPTTGVTLVTGESAIVAWNGSDYVKVASSTADGVTTFSAGTTGFTPSTATSGAVTLAGTLATTNGGTGLTSFTANRVFYASSTSAIAQSANLTFDGTTLTANNFTDSSLTSGRVTYAGTGGNLVDSANLTFDGTNLTLGGGTANGVAYLNGSKVLTTGSALQYDGSNLFLNSGSTWATASGGLQFSMNGNDGYITTYYDTHTVTLGAGVSSKNQIKVSGSGGSNNINFKVNGSDAMALTSTGLGIGTSSPNAKLTVGDSSGAVLGIPTTATFYGTSSISSSVGTVGLFSTETAAADVGPILTFGGKSGNSFSPYPFAFIQGAKASATAGDYSGYLRFFTVPSDGSGPVERLRINASGNLGLGVTPSAWSTSVQTALQVYTAGVSGNGGGNTASRFTHGCYLDGSTWKYQYTGVGPARYEITGPNSGSTHSWSIAAGGTAGNAISFTQAMTLDASGNLGLGTTSPNRLLSLFATQPVFQITNVASGNTQGTIQYQASGGTDFILDNQGSGSGGTIIFQQAGNERARITSGGQFAMSANGTASAPAITRSSDLDTGIFFPAANELGFAVNGVEELRITSAGFTRPVAYADTVSALGNTGTATTINLLNANVFTATLTGNCTFTLSNPIATGSSSFTLILTNDGTAGRTVAWAGGSFVFPGGASALSRTTTANAVDVWVFFTPNGGTTWYGNIAMKDMKA